VVEVAEQNRIEAEGANRRAAFRIEVSCAVDVTVDNAAPATDSWERQAGGRLLRTTTEDVSTTGVRIRTPDPLRSGTRAALRITYGDEVAEVVAQVMHGAADDFGAFAGMHFLVIDPRTRAALTRFIAQEERARLPNVRVMYEATCRPDGDAKAIEGATEECTPGFTRLLLPQPLAPSTAVHTLVTTTRQRFRMKGQVVTSRRKGELWSTGIRLSHEDAAAAEAWRSLLAQLRASMF
jgi:hypothetical protein